MILKFLLLSICVLIPITNGKHVKTKNIAYMKNAILNEEKRSIEKFKNKANLGNELAKIQLYYECLCPDCRSFDSKSFKQTVLDMGSYLDIYLYPYGNARTKDNGGGNYTITCQHGPRECYGNKLHACAIDALQNITLAVLYNSCMMDYSHGLGSDDAAADVCGTSMSIDSTPIKECANSAKGQQLLKYYGDESKKANFQYVPYVLINGVEGRSDDHFKEDVCKAFKSPPQQCKR